MCHGPIKWGKDGGSFCSNPACHGRSWPELDLNTELAAPAAPAKSAEPATAAPPAKTAAADAKKATGK